MLIRKATPDDAKNFIELNKILDRESSFMLFEPDERTFDVEHQRDSFTRIQDSDFVVVFVAECDEQIVAFAGMTRFSPRRASRTANMVIGVCSAYQRQGIGVGLLQAIEEWAKERMIVRIELTVMEHNHGAIALYKRCGFETEGIRRSALWVDGVATNEVYMAKLLPS